MISSIIKCLKHYRPWWAEIIEGLILWKFRRDEYRPSGDRPFIAVVNDEPELAYLYKDMLNQIKWAKAIAFTDPIKALKHFNLNHREYAGLISDCRMPGMSGIEFLEKAKEICPSVTTIYTCGCFYGTDWILKNCDFVDKYLPMPFSITDLIREVESIRLSKTKVS